MSGVTFYNSRAKYRGMDASMMAPLAELEEENRRPKKMDAEEEFAPLAVLLHPRAAEHVAGGDDPATGAAGRLTSTFSCR